MGLGIYYIEFVFVFAICFLNAFLINLFLKKYFIAMQLGEYKNSNYFDYLKSAFNGSIKKQLQQIIISFLIAIFITLIFLLLEIPLIFSFISIVAYLYVVLSIIENEFKIESKSSINFTKRFLRLYILNFMLNTIIGFTCVIYNLYFVNYISFSIICLTLPLSLLVFPLANILLIPFENIVKLIFINIAKKKLKRFPNLIKIAITGSYGKTSTKFILQELLKSKYNVCISPKSYNTQMGLCKTIKSELQPYHNILIAEMGANVKNDIKKLCKLINPNIGIITSIGNAHLKTFKTFENLINTKYQLVESVSKNNGIMFLNCNNEIIKEFYNSAKCEKYEISNGDNSIISIKNVIFNDNGMSFNLQYKNECIECETKLIGEHNIENILLAVSVALKLGVSLNEIKIALKRLRPIKHRLELKRSDNFYILDDAFNSNIIGAISALKVLGLFNGKKIVVTPGIVELGNESYSVNKKFAKSISKFANVCIVVNKINKQAFIDGLDKSIKIYYADNFEIAMNYLKCELEKDCCVLFENDLPDNYI